jgi:hypothetical protein
VRIIYFFSVVVLLGYSLPALAEIGTITSLTGKVQLRTNKAEIKVVEVGTSVHMNDMIKVRTESSATILMNDQSIFTVGPKSTLVFDDFLYDEINQKLRVRIIDGSLTYDSPNLTVKSDREFIYRNNTLVIRGTEFAAKFSLQSQIILLEGIIEVKNGKSGILLDKPMQSVKFGSNKISDLFLVSHEEVLSFFKSSGLDVNSLGKVENGSQRQELECYLNKVKIECPIIK